MKIENELPRLLVGPKPGNKVKGLGIVLFKAYCPGKANDVLHKCREVFEVVLREDGENWPSDDEWRMLLPQWFVARCSTETTKEEDEQWLEWWQGLSSEEQRRVSEEEKWALSEWIYWFQLNNRQWFWWNAFVKDSNILYVAVEIEGWPFPWGSLDWLLRASGANSIQPEDANL